MRRAVAAAVVFVCLACEPGSARAAQTDVVSLRAAIEARVVARAGVAIAAGWIDGANRGTIVAGGPSAAGEYDARTRFEIGSVTKTFTAALLANMVLSHEVALDETVGSLLPSDVTVPAATASITLEQLATQTSGLPRLPTNIHPADITDPYADYRLADMWSFLRDYKLPRRPGATYEYSNFGIALLGQLLAVHAHRSYADLLTSRILDPLGMASTSLEDAGGSAGVARPHDADGRITSAWHDVAFSPAGALRSNLSDMMRYLSANLDDRSSPIGAALRLTQRPRTAGNAENRIGLAWNINAANVVWHNGATGGFWAFVAFDRIAHRGVVILTNAYQPIDDIAWHYLDPARPLHPPEAEAALSADALERLPGTYSDGRITIIVRRNRDVLSVAQPDAPDALLHESLTGDYFLRADGTRFAIVRDGTGAVTALVATTGTMRTTLLRR